jgi:hypothetical protein
MDYELDFNFCLCKNCVNEFCFYSKCCSFVHNCKYANSFFKCCSINFVTECDDFVLGDNSYLIGGLKNGKCC